jgi:AAA domain
MFQPPFPPPETDDRIVRERIGLPEAAVPSMPGPRIRATSYTWRDPGQIPPREWIHGYHYIRQFISTTVAPGGVGKSSLALVEAIAIATGRPLLGMKPNERTRVWYWNGEDPQEEVERRVAAILLLYRIPKEELEGSLFLNSGQLLPILIAQQVPKGGAELLVANIEDLEGTIQENGIGVVILDPFISIHRVPENDNGMIDAVVKALAGVADRTRCAIELVHHVRKTNGSEVTVEDGRGAIALLNAARCARAINQMSEAEADKWGVVNRRSHFRYFDGKANLAPPSETSTWFRLESVDLGNKTDSRPSDKIGVVIPWEPPKPFDNVTTPDMHEVRLRVGIGEWRLDSQSQDWVGKCVADVLRLDLSDKAVKAKVKAILNTWIKNGALKVEEHHDRKRTMRRFVVPGNFENDG